MSTCKEAGRSQNRSGLTVLQHNCQNNWNAVEIVFSLCTSISSTPDIIALQEVPFWKGNIPSHPGFQAFSPPPSTDAPPKVATYVSRALCTTTHVYTVMTPPPPRARYRSG